MKRTISSTEAIVIENIERLLKDNRLPQAKLASLTGIPGITLSQVLNNRMVMRIDHVHRIAEAFGLPPYQLLMKDLTEDIPSMIERMRNTPGSREQALSDLVTALSAYVKETPRVEQFSLFKFVREEPMQRGNVKVYETHIRDKAVIYNFCAHMKKIKKVVGIKIFSQSSSQNKKIHLGTLPKLLAEYNYNRTTRKGIFHFYQEKNNNE